MQEQDDEDEDNSAPDQNYGPPPMPVIFSEVELAEGSGQSEVPFTGTVQDDEAPLPPEDQKPSRKSVSFEVKLLPQDSKFYRRPTTFRPHGAGALKEVGEAKKKITSVPRKTSVTSGKANVSFSTRKASVPSGTRIASVPSGPKKASLPSGAKALNNNRRNIRKTNSSIGKSDSNRGTKKNGTAENNAGNKSTAKPILKDSTKRSSLFDSADILSPSRDRRMSVTLEEKRSLKDTMPTIPSSTRPEWYQDLSEEQIIMFKNVFDLLDRDGGGSIDATELYKCMSELDIDISLDEILSVLTDLDADGNGEIDFDEFLYAMAQTEKYLDEMITDPEKAHSRERYSRRQNLLFSAITSFAMKNSIGEMERYYASKIRQAPHVISYYTAGARLIGLNERQLELELRKMQKKSKDQDSPYAKPLPFVTTSPRKKTKKKKVPTATLR